MGQACCNPSARAEAQEVVLEDQLDTRKVGQPEVIPKQKGHEESALATERVPRAAVAPAVD